MCVGVDHARHNDASLRVQHLVIGVLFFQVVKVADRVDKLTGYTHRAIFDRNEVASWASAALATDGDIFVAGAAHDGRGDGDDGLVRGDHALGAGGLQNQFPQRGQGGDDHVRAGTQDQEA